MDEGSDSKMSLLIHIITSLILHYFVTVVAKHCHCSGQCYCSGQLI